MPLILLQGQPVELSLDPDKVAVRFKDDIPKSGRASVVNDASELGSFAHRIEVPRTKYTIVPVAQTDKPRAERQAEAVANLSTNPQVVKVNPVFKVGEKTVLVTDRIIVGLDDTADESKIFKDYQSVPLNASSREFVLTIPEGEDVLEVAGKIADMRGVRYAEPDFTTIGQHIPKPQLVGPMGSDPLESQQYALRITHAQEALGLKKGSPDIRIAILDEGVDAEHEDLKAAIVGTFDAVDGDSYQQPNPWDGHGTACAGLAAAVHSNDKGIKATGSGCSILAVRIALSESKGARWVTSDSWIARAIDWAWQEGKADVLSNSWGGGPQSSAIAEAFKRAGTRGRNGKGCAIVIAAGNDAGPVSFPGTLKDVLTVSATNEYDEFKTKTSRDGENWWGSNYGPEIGIGAPGVHNLTTDISGADGYNPANYTPNFNGTSSATPIVAGAAGLLLSAKPTLRGVEVHQLLKDTADKIGSAPYYNGRNDQFGYGRLNVLAALKLLIVAAPIPGPAPDVSFHLITHLMEGLDIAVLRGDQLGSTTLAVGEDAAIQDVAVMVDIKDARTQDLKVELQAPAGSPIVLHDRTLVGSITREYRPGDVAALRGLFGQSARGNWQLRVTSAAREDQGKIKTFGLRLGYGEPAEAAEAAEAAGSEPAAHTVMPS